MNDIKAYWFDENSIMKELQEKMTKKNLPPLDPKYALVNWKDKLHFYRHNVQPGLSEWEIERMKYSWFLYYKFFQDNGLTTRKMVETPDDMETLIVYAGDRTLDGEKLIGLHEQAKGTLMLLIAVPSLRRR